MDVLAIFQDSPKATTVKAGSYLFHQGEPANEMYVVLSGRVEVRRDGQVIEVLEPGAILGEMAIVDERPRSADAVAVVDSSVEPVDAEWFKHLIRKSPNFGLHVMGVMAQRLRRFMDQGS